MIHARAIQIAAIPLSTNATPAQISQMTWAYSTIVDLRIRANIKGYCSVKIRSEA
jgi:hypothetical protein